MNLMTIDYLYPFLYDESFVHYQRIYGMIMPMLTPLWRCASAASWEESAVWSFESLRKARKVFRLVHADLSCPEKIE
jgi:hypothetical protein